MDIVQKFSNEVAQALLSAQEKRDCYTVGHQNKVVNISLAIAQHLHLEADVINGLEIAAHLHDIGKIGIPAELLTKPAKLSKEEFDLIKTHAQAGYDIVNNISFPWPVAQIILQHHERINGCGYPNQLKDKDILFEAKIIAVADTLDSMASHRPYRAALGLDIAMAELNKMQGILYDEEIVGACMHLYKENKLPNYQDYNHQSKDIIRNKII